VGGDSHRFDPKPEDLKQLGALDAVVVNGIGHDSFLDKMLKAVGKPDMPRIPLNRGVPLINRSSDPDTPNYNPHTFISISASIQQVYNLEKGLAELFPQHAAAFKNNTQSFVRKLRKLKAATARALLDIGPVRIATVHDGYAYLMQEFNLRVERVIEPRHGMEPSPRELAETIDTIREAKLDVIFGERHFPKKYVDMVVESTGVRFYALSHINGGKYEADKFENEMKYNLDILVKALVTDAPADR
jgi:zinc transport system substrate-binding protein